MKELLSEWTYWMPILVGIGILLLYGTLSGGKGPLAALLAGEAVALIYFIILPEFEASVLLAIVLSCALDGLIVNWKNPSLIKRAVYIVLFLLPLIICGIMESYKKTGVFIPMLFQFLLSIIYVLPRRKYRQDGRLKCFSLWGAQVIVVGILMLPGLFLFDFRLSYVLNHEISIGTAVFLMPVIAMLPFALYDLLLWDVDHKKHTKGF